MFTNAWVCSQAPAKEPNDAGNDRDFRQQVLARWLVLTERAVDAAKRVFHRHLLRAGCLFVLLGSAEAGEEVGDMAVDQARAVELGQLSGGDRNIKVAVPPANIQKIDFGSASDDDDRELALHRQFTYDPPRPDLVYRSRRDTMFI